MSNDKFNQIFETLSELKNEVSKLQKQNPQSLVEELMTRQEVARLLKIDLSTLHHWTKSGILTKYGIGKRVYYKRSEIENAIVELETLKS